VAARALAASFERGVESIQLNRLASVLEVAWMLHWLSNRRFFVVVL